MTIESFKNIETFIKNNNLSQDIEIVFDVNKYNYSSSIRYETNEFQIGVGVKITINETLCNYIEIIPMWFNDSGEQLDINKILEEVWEETSFKTKEEYENNVVDENLVIILNFS